MLSSPANSKHHLAKPSTCQYPAILPSAASRSSITLPLSFTFTIQARAKPPTTSSTEFYDVFASEAWTGTACVNGL
ncbi:hypothetical protein [Infirmifilum sp. NZ]|uniref:hypothetical protein n=1 Tax=Infirmifilum sp. NZ TaxID=2926850 RepID=UPI00279AE09F|nr:hypothetical protein [Infirmifilum sp. NZ]UNQ73561.1 hypothetical protein MOV14_00760 [Infirmifilum sp. NZ]